MEQTDALSPLQQFMQHPHYELYVFIAFMAVFVIGAFVVFLLAKRPEAPTKAVEPKPASKPAAPPMPAKPAPKPEAEKPEPKPSAKPAPAKPVVEKPESKPAARPKPAPAAAKPAPKPEAKKPEPVAAKSKPAPAPSKPAEPETPSVVAELKNDKTSWLDRLRGGLQKTRNQLQGGLGELLTGKVDLTEDTLEDIHELLFRSDVGVETADELVDHIRRSLKKADIKKPTADDIRGALKERIAAMLDAPIKGPVVTAKSGPTVILIVGVNGVGKTTSIGKLGARFLSEDKTVMLAAADTFRAAAIDQLKVWGERIGSRVIHHKQNGDPAAVAFDAVKAAKAADVDYLLIDTAGRLHNKKELMAELEKINKIIGREIPEAPHETWLVVDATTGQNAHMQIKAFKEVVALTGLIVTKLDGTAKGGVVVGACHQYDLPVRYIGVGEQAADLREFAGADFAAMMV